MITMLSLLGAMLAADGDDSLSVATVPVRSRRGGICSVSRIRHYSFTLPIQEQRLDRRHHKLFAHSRTLLFSDTELLLTKPDYRADPAICYRLTYRAGFSRAHLTRRRLCLKMVSAPYAAPRTSHTRTFRACT